MGASGSGRHRSFRGPTCETSHSIDLAWLRRKGLLQPGRASTVTWSRHGQSTGSIRVVAQDNGVRLAYRTTARDGTSLEVAELVPFAFTPTRFGGRRTWFRCLACGRGCRVLYGGSRFRCRRCHGLRYDSQHEASHQRALSQADKLRKRLADQLGCAVDEDVFDDFPPKPKRMRWATYWRLEERYTELQNQWVGGVLSGFARG